jgi:hypothetical protein
MPPVLLLLFPLAALACDLTGLLPPFPTVAPVFPETSFTPFPGLGDSLMSVGPAPIGTSLSLGNVELRVDDFVWPADDIVKRADGYPSTEAGEQFAVVDVTVTCRAASGESCNVTEFNFKMNGAAGATFYPELTMSFSDLRGLLDTGLVPAGESRSGYVVFILDRAAADLTLIYSPLAGVPGPSASFDLGR